MLFNDIIKNIDKNNIINSISTLPESVLNILLEDSNYNNILITKEDKITLLKSLSSYNKESTDYSFINNIPSSINTILFPNSVIDNINITTEDKVQFISKMSTLKEDSSVNDIYKVVETLPDSIQKLINPKMNMNKITKMAIILIIIYIISALFNYLEGLFMVKVANKVKKQNIIKNK